MGRAKDELESHLGTYPDDEREFLAAAERYRAARKKKFLTATDYLRVALELGYRRPEGEPPAGG